MKVGVFVVTIVVLTGTPSVVLIWCCEVLVLVVPSFKHSLHVTVVVSVSIELSCAVDVASGTGVE